MSTIQIPDYPSNLFDAKTKSQEKEKKKIEKVITGDATKQKRTAYKKVGDFIKTDGKDILLSLLEDKIIPSLKSLIYDAFTGGMNMLLYKDDKGNTSTPFFLNTNRINYGSFFYSNNPVSNKISPRRTATISTVDDILFSTKSDADIVLAQLVDLIEMYGFASVSDYYELTGFVGAHTDERYGWSDLSTASIKRVKNGWAISFPRVTPIG